jgi:uncharacterized membrane protein
MSEAQNKGLAVLCYLGILIIVPILTEARKHPFVKFHLKQGLALLTTWIAVGILASTFGFALAASGFLFFGFIFPLVYLVLFIIEITGIINAATGQMKELPIIGSLGSKFEF